MKLGGLVVGILAGGVLATAGMTDAPPPEGFSWFFQRFGETTSSNQHVYTLEEFSVTECGDVVEAAVGPDSNARGRARQVLATVLYPDLMKLGRASIVSRYARRLQSRAYADALLKDGENWVLEYLPSGVVSLPRMKALVDRDAMVYLSCPESVRVLPEFIDAFLKIPSLVPDQIRKIPVPARWRSSVAQRVMARCPTCLPLLSTSQRGQESLVRHAIAVDGSQLKAALPPASRNPAVIDAALAKNPCVLKYVPADLRGAARWTKHHWLREAGRWAPGPEPVRKQVRALSISGDGRRLMVLRDRVELYDLERRKMLWRGPKAVVAALRPDGKEILAANDRGMVMGLDGRTGVPIGAVAETRSTISCAGYCGTTERRVVGSTDGKVWEIIRHVSYRIGPDLPYGGMTVRSASLDLAGRWIILGPEGQSWSFASGEGEWRNDQADGGLPRGWTHALAIAPNTGAMMGWKEEILVVAFGSSTGWSYVEVELPESKIGSAWGSQGRYWQEHTTAACFTPNGAIAFAGFDTGQLSSGESGKLGMLPPLAVNGVSLTGVAASDDGRVIATADGEGRVHLVDGLSGDYLGQLENSDPLKYPSAVTAIAVTASGEQCFAGRADGRVLVWDGSGSPRLASTPTGHPIVDLKASDTGGQVVAVHSDGSVTLVRSESGRWRAIRTKLASRVIGAVFAPGRGVVLGTSDGRTLELSMINLEVIRESVVEFGMPWFPVRAGSRVCMVRGQEPCMVRVLSGTSWDDAGYSKRGPDYSRESPLTKAVSVMGADDGTVFILGESLEYDGEGEGYTISDLRAMVPGSTSAFDMHSYAQYSYTSQRYSAAAFAQSAGIACLASGALHWFHARTGRWYSCEDELGAPVTAIGLSGDGRRVWVGTTTGQLRVFRLQGPVVSGAAPQPPE